MKLRFLALASVLTLAGCHAGAQIPPTTHSLTLTVTSTVQPGSTWVASKAVLASGATTCPATTGTAYAQINATPQASSTFVDTGSAGQTVCEIMQYELAGAVSPPSNAVGPYSVPANPTAPAINAQQASNAEPLSDRRPNGIGDPTTWKATVAVAQSAEAYDKSCRRLFKEPLSSPFAWVSAVAPGVYAPCDPLAARHKPEVVASVR